MKMCTCSIYSMKYFVHFTWRMTLDSWHILHDTRHKTHETWHMTHNTTLDIGYMTHDTWNMTHDTWHITDHTSHIIKHTSLMTNYTWNMTSDTRHITHDTWHMTHIFFVFLLFFGPSRENNVVHIVRWSMCLHCSVLSLITIFNRVISFTMNSCHVLYSEFRFLHLHGVICCAMH